MHAPEKYQITCTRHTRLHMQRLFSETRYHISPEKHFFRKHSIQLIKEKAFAGRTASNFFRKRLFMEKIHQPVSKQKLFSKEPHRTHRSKDFSGRKCIKFAEAKAFLDKITTDCFRQRLFMEKLLTVGPRTATECNRLLYKISNSTEKTA